MKRFQSLCLLDKNYIIFLLLITFPVQAQPAYFCNNDFEGIIAQKDVFNEQKVKALIEVLGVPYFYLNSYCGSGQHHFFKERRCPDLNLVYRDEVTKSILGDRRPSYTIGDTSVEFTFTLKPFDIRNSTCLASCKTHSSIHTSSTKALCAICIAHNSASFRFERDTKRFLNFADVINQLSFII